MLNPIKTLNETKSQTSKTTLEQKSQQQEKIYKNRHTDYKKKGW